MAEYPQGWLAYEGEWGGKQGEWRCDPKQSGGVNCLGDLGTHVENAVSMLTGLKIRRVLAKMDVVVPGRVLDDNDVVLVEYEGGATGCYWTSQFAIGHDNDLRVRIYGENGSILWAQEECEKVTMIDRDGTIVERHRGGGGSCKVRPSARRSHRGLARVHGQPLPLVHGVPARQKGRHVRARHDRFPDRARRRRRRPLRACLPAVEPAGQRLGDNGRKRITAGPAAPRERHKGGNMEQELLVMKNINKSFPGVRALRDVSLSLRRGEVHALIGENGAGKSTLMKVLSGVHQADSGEILWEGKPVQIHSTTEATAMGISIIYQELNLMPNMSIRENIFLGRENRKARFFVDFQKTSELAKTYTDMVGLTADVNTLVKDLSIAQRQMVEVAKALSTNAKLIVMDEPTSSLTDRETEILMNVIRNLRDQGVTVVFISHRLSELFEISDRITVLRDGECVGTIDTKDCTEPQLVNMMVGRTLDDIYPKGNAQIGEAVLEAKHLNAGKMVQDVSFTLHRGEILGFAGLIGAGRSEVMRAIFGVDPLDSGEIIIDGKKLEKHTPTDAIRAGLGLVPEDRKLLGLILDMSVRENTTLPCLPVEMKGGILSRKKENEITQTYIEQLDIKTPGAEQKVLNLSGGNQQKVVIGKWLATHPKVLILDEPTRGIDVGAKREIHQLMSKLADQGVGIIMISSEMPEVLGMSDRIIVMHEGHVCGELSRSEATQERIMSLILSAAG